MMKKKRVVSNFKDKWSKRYNRFIRLDLTKVVPDEKFIYKLTDDMYYVLNKDRLMTKHEVEVYINTKKPLKNYVKYMRGLNM